MIMTTPLALVLQVTHMSLLLLPIKAKFTTMASDFSLQTVGVPAANQLVLYRMFHKRERV